MMTGSKAPAASTSMVRGGQRCLETGRAKATAGQRGRPTTRTWKTCTTDTTSVVDRVPVPGGQPARETAWTWSEPGCLQPGQPRSRIPDARRLEATE